MQGAGQTSLHKPGACIPSTASILHLGDKLGLKLGSYSQDTWKKQEDAKGPTEH